MRRIRVNYTVERNVQKETTGDIELQKELALAYLKMGDVQEKMYAAHKLLAEIYARRGETEKAEFHRRKIEEMSG